jgi:hypothetical protein
LKKVPTSKKEEINLVNNNLHVAEALDKLEEFVRDNVYI